MKTTLSEKGQITIPKLLREQLGLTTGTVLEFTSENGRLVGVKRSDRDSFHKWRGIARLPVGKSGGEYLGKVRDDYRR